MELVNGGMDTRGYDGGPAGKGKEEMTRRKFLLGAGSGAALAAAGARVYMGRMQEQEAGTEPAPQEQKAETGSERGEGMPEPPEAARAFERQRESLEEWFNLKFDEVIFVDKDGAVAAGPLTLKDAVDRDGGAVSVGRRNEAGLLVGGISGSWLKHWRNELGVGEGGGVLHVTKDFEKFFNKTDEPELVEGIKRALGGRRGIQSLRDVTLYYGFNSALKPVRGDELGRSRAAYLYSEVRFAGEVPSLVQEELRELLVGIAAYESRFNASAMSSAAAMGVMQFMPNVRKEYGFDPAQRLSFKDEVELAGRYMSDAYKRTGYWMRNKIVTDTKGGEARVEQPETMERLRRVFADEESWMRRFYVPCMVSGYNAGQLTVGQGLHNFVEAHSDEELKELAGGGDNYGLYHAFSKYAQADDSDRYVRTYGDKAQAYFAGVLSCRDTLKNRSETLAAR